MIAIDLWPLHRIHADPGLDLKSAYLYMLETFQANFARAVGTVARAPADGVVIHCVAGRDRTGLVSALLLRLAGVEVDVVAADWAESDPNLVTELEGWVVAAPDPVERRRREAWTKGDLRAAVENVLVELDRRHGGASGYLRAAGVEDGELELARARLRG